MDRASFKQATCIHEKERHYTRKQLDVLNGLDLTLTRCLNCHKVLLMEVKSISK
jgi:hypothetical protein